MANSSATGGFLTPASPLPLDGIALLNYLQEWFVGIGGIDPTLVRPRWQKEPGNIPRADLDWVAFGIINTTPDTFAAELHFPNGQGYNEIRRHSTLDLLVSVYGPNAQGLADLLLDGMQVEQNRQHLKAQALDLAATGETISVPELLKQTWYNRIDFHVWINRQKIRQYPVYNLETAHATLNNELYIEEIEVKEIDL